ncbi:MAG TPA: MerR family transcriptional regulator [Saprospiraceae bacterium]|nr:MerR family transcriptional regulator [Saprospiraceae bacterium]HRO08807.1 MerR family transcriptional regulator [Saprospiraceae bacterium]HRP41672.1 MerR family transcriptional regulator [Saprospiraceae bacterium]
MQLPELTKLYYSIGEVADMFGIAPTVLRYWESEFSHLRPAKNSKGDRKYTVKDIQKIEEVFHLIKEKGFKIEGARKELDRIKTMQKDTNQILIRLQMLRKKVVDLRNEVE